MPGAQGSTRKVDGSGTIVTLGTPLSSSTPNPPPAMKGLKTIELAGSRENGAIEISLPLRSAASKAGIVSDLPLRSPC